MRSSRKLALRREQLTPLDPGTLRDVAGAGTLAGCPVVLQDFTDWQSICWCYTTA